MSEGNIYLAQCIEEDDVFKLKLKKPFECTVEGKTIEEAKVELALEIAYRIGDGEALIEVFPPLQSKSEVGLTCLVAASYNDSVNALNSAYLFDDGVCEKCGFGKGKRNSEVLLEVDQKPLGLVCGVVKTYPNIMIYSEGFVEQLKPSELKTMALIPVLYNGNECGYFEAIPQKVIPQIGHIGASYPEAFQQSWKCGKCDRKKFVVDSKEFDFGTIFIGSDSLNSTIPSIIFIDEGFSVCMAFTVERWKEFVNGGKKRGVTSNSVIVVFPDFQEIPELSEPDIFEWI
ncbi:hypothetical protein [Alteromonas sp. PRIM-21]|uniref:hypothetical protein n=1 Tax=Alteromonas sp. PRIM-21 TaxID=1454978 RepID=UPI0022B958E1|nr:hypothetical protein [Alteromonas sp. PRIM-21]MCZ8530395.1 hypothetical protein [Alteromonas sp. PRIM-21]